MYVYLTVDRLFGSVETIIASNILPLIIEQTTIKYVRLADQLLRILKHCRIPLYLHRKSNHIYTVWQHIVLVTIRQYEGKSYRMFTDWLVEAYYLRLFLQLSKIPHYTTLQKFTDKINIVMLGKIISRHIFAGIDSTGFKITHASEYYTSRAKLRRKKYAKLIVNWCRCITTNRLFYKDKTSSNNKT
jgi:hypothetical protein